MNSLPPGRELDAIIAERVIGIKKIPFDKSTHFIKEALEKWGVGETD